MKRGRRVVPDELKRKNITITFSPELYDWVQKQSHNISRWLEQVLLEVKTAQEAESMAD